MQEQFRYSDHIIISDDYYKKDDQLFKLAYSGLSGKLLSLGLDDHEKIKNKVLPLLDSKLFAQLKDAEMIVQTGITDVEAIIQRNNTKISSPSQLNFVILPSSFCNMGCTYCGQSHTKGSISDDLIIKIVNRIHDAIKKTNTKELFISWFGGEPLVSYKKILNLSAFLINLAIQYQINYEARIVTNGSLLTLSKLIELHEQCRINEVNITLDGPEEIHNRRRRLKNDKTSFSQITQLIQAALSEPRLKNLRYVLRTNIDKENEAYVSEYLQTMYSLGFSDQRIGYELKAVYPWSNDVSKVELAKQDFADKEITWMIQTLELGLQYSYLLKANKITCITVSPYSEVISADGKIFTCTEHPLVPQHTKDLVAHVGEAWEKRNGTGQFDDFNKKILEKQVPCSSCKLLGVCGGACPKHWSEGFAPCPSIKYNIQARLNIAAVTMGYQIVENDLSY